LDVGFNFCRSTVRVQRAASLLIIMYEDVTTVVRVNGRDSKAFGVRVGVHQGSVLSTLLFTIVLEACPDILGKADRCLLLFSLMI